MNIVSCSVYYSKALAGGTFPALRKFNYVERNSEKIKQKSKAKKKSYLTALCLNDTLRKR